MFEWIIDVTNRCYLQCRLCGTDSDIDGEKSLPVQCILDIMHYAQTHPCSLFLGGGCFFCHPYHEQILLYMKKIQMRGIIIDIPMCEETLESLRRFPMNQYHYTASVSLWGIGETHNTLTRSHGYQYLDQFQKRMRLYQGHSAFSFVITRDLIKQQEEVSAFLETLEEQDSVYFHRLMPTGRCGLDYLPETDAIMKFYDYISSHIYSCNIRFHHTILNHSCTAYKDRLFVDWNGDVFGCGWVGKNKPFANLQDISIESVMSLMRKQSGYQCPIPSAASAGMHAKLV